MCVTVYWIASFLPNQVSRVVTGERTNLTKRHLTRFVRNSVEQRECMALTWLSFFECQLAY